MINNEKSYLEIKVTFLHIIILLVGVILIGVFLFVLGFNAGKSSADKNGMVGKQASQKEENVEIKKKEDPDKIIEAQEPPAEMAKTEPKNTPGNEEIQMHIPEAKDDTTETTVPKKKFITAPKTVTRETYYAIQGASFNSHELAKNYADKFSRIGYPTDIEQAAIKGKTWYRVRVGQFATHEDAETSKGKLEKLEKKKFAIVKVN